jgi:hypothetical protein
MLRKPAGKDACATRRSAAILAAGSGNILLPVPVSLFGRFAYFETSEKLPVIVAACRPPQIGQETKIVRLSTESRYARFAEV